MSCITLIGRHRHFEDGCEYHLPRSSPPFRDSLWMRLVNMAFSEDPFHRAVAASDPNLPEEFIPRLAKDETLLVRISLAKNIRHEAIVLPLLKDDEDPGIRAYVKMVTENE